MNLIQPHYKTFLKNWGSFLFILLTALSYTSCSSTKSLSKSEIQALAHAGNRLGIDIGRKDNHALMLEAANWIGVPYRYGGTTVRGVDCSGFTRNIYKKVYGITLTHSSQNQLDKDVREKVKKKNLEQGDLLFFSPKRSKRKINHVGIYLKNGKFIHASTSKGVRVDHLEDNYWTRQWVTGGRIIKSKK